MIDQNIILYMYVLELVELTHYYYDNHTFIYTHTIPTVHRQIDFFIFILTLND